MSRQGSRRVFRFAPSPNGYLHRGHAYSALLNHRASLASGGRMLLRMEDVDRQRSRPEFAAAIEEDLAWLGIGWETPVLRQSERDDAYRVALAELQKTGLVYPAFLSRAEIVAAVAVADATGQLWPRDPDGAPLYPGGERDWAESRRRKEMESGRPYAWRLDAARALGGLPELTWRESNPLRGGRAALHHVDPAAWGDVVIARKDMPASYHLAVVVDDAFQSITDVVRGLDLRPATSVHRVLQQLLNLPEPIYFHHRLILDETGRKLAKSRGSQTLRARRAAGETLEELIAELDLPA